MTKALITGVTGQDGPYLARLLLEKGYQVTGTYRREATEKFENLEYLGIQDDINLIPMDLTEYESVRRAIHSTLPDEIYNLAAQSHVGLSFKVPLATLAATGLGVAHILEAMRSYYPDKMWPKFYQASTSELFGGTSGRNQTFDEDTPFHPRSPYACAKLYAYSMVVNYREAYGMFGCNGILFNHESPLRGENFVTRKVTAGAARICHALVTGRDFEPLRVGNVDASRDWGHAEDYVRAMWMMMQQDGSSDYVIATGKNHTVRDLIVRAFNFLGVKGTWEGEGLDTLLYVDWNGERKVLVEIEPKFFRPSDCNDLTGDATKARTLLGWKPKHDFYSLVEDMVRRDYTDLVGSGDEDPNYDE